MKNEMVTNKVLTPLTLIPEKADDDAVVWNKFLDERTEIEGETPTWFNTIWLYCECYMYRRIAQEFALTYAAFNNLLILFLIFVTLDLFLIHTEFFLNYRQRLKNYDPFEKQKQDGFNKSLNSIIILSQYVMDLINRKAQVLVAERKHEFIKLLKLNLWGNR